MTSYSFGWRWVGIVALREPPAPEPLHKMALRLRQASHTRTVSVAGRGIPADELLQLLGGVRYRLGLSGLAARAQECLRVEQAIRSGRTPKIRPWLHTKVAEAQRSHAPHSRTAAPAAVAPPDRDLRRQQPASRPPGPRSQPVPTGWSTAYPQAPDSPWLPPLGEGLASEIEQLGLDLGDEAERWLRWACLHSSFLYEQARDQPIDGGLLDLLAMLGKGWLRLGIIDRARARRGEFSSNSEVSRLLSSTHDVLSDLGSWVTAREAGLYGRGELSQLAAGQSSRAPHAVGLQIVGALSLVTGSQAPADALLEALSYEPPMPEPDWQGLLVSALKAEPTYRRSEEGADHEKVFTVTVTANGRSVSAAGRSVKAARKKAQREYVHRHLPHMIPKAITTTKVNRPRPYSVSLPAHDRAARWAAEAFEVRDVGMMSQALTHRSWVYENQAIVSAAGQRDYGTLATEGSEVLTTLVRHAHAIQLLNSTFTPGTHHINPNVEGRQVALLFDAMPVSAGVLRSRGMDILSTDIKEDVAQAITAVAWRANGDRLAERQPAVLAKWLADFKPPEDPTTELQEYCARAGIGFDFAFEDRGAHHQAEFRAQVVIHVDGDPSWWGDWATRKTPAKQSAAALALAALVETDTGTEQDEPDGDVDAVIREAFVAELRTLTPSHVVVHRDMAAGVASVDRLAAGDYRTFIRWASARTRALREQDLPLTEILPGYYEAVLIANRRDLVSKWIVGHTPQQGGRSADPVDRVRAWWASPQPGRLALLGDMLVALRQPDARTAVMDFVQQQAAVLADAASSQLEAERSNDAGGTALSVRVTGTDLGRSFDPVVEVVELAGLGVRWTRDGDAVEAYIPGLPSVGDPIATAGLSAVEKARADSWLGDVEEALGQFLTVTENVFSAPNASPSPARMNELSLAELSLVLHLRESNETGT